MKKAKKWIRFRHKIMRNILYLVMYPYVRWKYHLRTKRLPDSRGKQYLILYNHQTPMDQFFIGVTFREPVYYVASEDIFSNGFVSSLIRYLVAPIPIKKNSSDVRAVLNCLKVAREGGSIAIAPEGNRTYSGKTGYIAPSIAPLARKLALPIAFVRIEGGYGVEPRWSDAIRKGCVHVSVSRVLSPEEYAALSDGALYDVICRELAVDESKTEDSFYSRRAAEYLERVLYVCPTCGLSVFESRKDTVRCRKCGLEVRYLPSTELQANRENFPFLHLADWYDYQCDFVNAMDTTHAPEAVLFTDTVDVSRVIVCKKKEKLYRHATCRLRSDGVTLEGIREWKFDDLSGAVVLGKNKFNLYDGDDVYQFKGGKRFNALKYVNLYHRRKNQMKEPNENGKFLGL